ncbi:hypothetical protein ID866_5264 [Astraeus odoratus]|nr:hypothetical protein ID866_5264 [Astraeus odoratus]
MSTQTQQTAPLARSNSFFGAIKNIVTAPLQWLAGTDDFEDTKGKRRRLPVPSQESRVEDDHLQSKAKRMRLASPHRDSQPYLDPPQTAFKQTRRAAQQAHSTHQRHLSASPRKALRVPDESGVLHPSSRSRHTLSPLPTRSHLTPEGITRTMSLDPPSNSSFSYRTQSVVSMQDVREEAGGPMPISRDSSMSPGRQLRVRSSLTPQPSGSNFGPVVPPRRERDPTQPPPLATLISNPTFVKPPPGLQKSDTTETAKQLTLGSLVESHRKARSPARQSSILFGTGSATTDVSARHLWPANAAEKALHELDVYKTPLLPTRLKATGTIPDMFLPKKSHPITLMNDGRDDKPRLGMTGKGKDRTKKKEKEVPKGSKPYAGEGGMKKWLARRRMEEEQAMEREKVQAMEDDQTEQEQKKKAEEEESKRSKQVELPPPPHSDTFQPGAILEGRETSSLRVGRTKIARNHIDRPISKRMKKFSAAYEDEDDEMDDARVAEQKMLEEAAKKAPVFDIPAGFTFAKEVGVEFRTFGPDVDHVYQVSITHDAANAREPPIASLPFSLTKSTMTPTSAPPPAEVTKPASVTVPPEPASSSAPAITLAPPVAVSPPTPDKGPADSATCAPADAASTPPSTASAASPAVSSGIPNFFAKSTVLAKPAAVVAPTPPPFTITPPVLAQESKPLAESEQKAAEPELRKVTEPAASVESTSRPPFAPLSIFGAAATSTPSNASLFDAPSATTGPSTTSFSAPSMSASTPSFVSPSPVVAPKDDGATTSQSSLGSSPFSFGAPKPAESIPPAPSEPPKTVVKETEASGIKPAAPFNFSFGTPASSGPAAPAPSEAAKPLFSSPAPPTSVPFSFGQSAETTKKEEKPATSPFSFTSTPAPPAATETKSTPAFSFSAPAASSAPTFTFGGPTPSGSNVADVSSKPFAFAPSTPVRPATPPKVEQEVNMDESPTREMNINGNGKPPERPSLNFSFSTSSTAGSALFAQSPVTPAPTFSFGSSTVNPFAKDTKPADDKSKVSFGFGGQPASSGFSFGQKAPETPVATSPATFSFGQPSPSVAPTSPFTFGTGSSNPFGQASANASSAPTSPSTFNRPASTPAFTFGPSATSQPSATPFSFGASSQPASPANNNTNLPASNGSTFTFGASSGTATTANPFSTTAPTSGSGTLFTIGAAPPQSEGGRQIKKLPRRGGARR